jgi:hypothetical protein
MINMQQPNKEQYHLMFQATKEISKQAVILEPLNWLSKVTPKTAKIQNTKIKRHF